MSTAQMEEDESWRMECCELEKTSALANFCAATELKGYWAVRKRENVQVHHTIQASIAFTNNRSEELAEGTGYPEEQAPQGSKVLII